MELRGLGYPAIICKNMQLSIEFYAKLGMRHLYTEPNRDDNESVQALLHAGGDSYVMLVGPSHEGVRIAEASLGVGSMQYLTLQVSAGFMDQAYFELSSAGVRGSEEIPARLRATRLPRRPGRRADRARRLVDRAAARRRPRRGAGAGGGDQGRRGRALHRGRAHPAGDRRR